jgi:hypothetical protein
LNINNAVDQDGYRDTGATTAPFPTLLVHQRLGYSKLNFITVGCRTGHYHQDIIS